MTESEDKADASGGAGQGLSFWAELKRRKVTRVAITYVVVSWLVIQIANTTFDGFGIPDWAFRFVVISLAIFFPVAIILAWAFDLTPEGLRTTKSLKAEVDSEPASEAHQKKRNRSALMFAAGLPTLIFGTLAVIFYLRGDPVPESEPPLAADAPQAQASGLSIAVLPLINMSANADNEFFAGGVHEDILTNLSRIDDFDVISRTTMLRYASSDQSLADIGRELGVQYIVEGSVRRVNNHVRVTVQLIDTGSDTHLWANNYDRELTDVFATQSSIAKEISQSVQFAIAPDDALGLEQLPTHSVRAYDLYLQAKSIDRGTPESEESLQSMAHLLEQAVQEDPDFVEAWGLLNEAYDHIIRNTIIQGWYAENHEARQAIVSELQPKAKRALDKAVALDPDNLETLLAQASDYWAEENVEGFQVDRKQYLDRAIELYPEQAMVWYVLAYWYRLNVDTENADTAFRKAIDLDPLNARILYGSTWHFDEMDDQEMLRTIDDRLNNSLGVSNPHSTMVIMRNEYLNTADDSMLLEMLLLIDREFNNFDTSAQAQFWRLAINWFAGDLEAIADIELWEAPPLNGDSMVWEWYLSISSDKAVALYLLGREEESRAVAELMLQRPDLAQRAPWTDSALVTAYSILGDSESASALANWMVDAIGVDYDMYGWTSIATLAQLDQDRAAALLLERLQDGSYARAADFFAANCFRNNPLMSHPDVVAFFVEQGKWVEHLARCTPEYRPYVDQILN